MVSNNGSEISDLQQIAGLFNKFFTLSRDDNNCTNTNNVINMEVPTLFLQPIDPQEIFNIIMKLPNKYSSGMDEIPIYALKFAGEYLAAPLADIINESISTQVFPSALKIAKVVPIHKKGSKQCIENYRPVSLLPAVSKVIERALYNRMMDYLNVHGILTDHQFGFRPKRSTEMAIYNVVNYIMDQLDNKDKVAGLYFDLSKAFDTVDHNILLDRIQCYGMRGACAMLLKSSQWTQTVCSVYVWQAMEKNYFQR